jgi:hypothetical protein
MKAALLYYQKFLKDILSMGFELNRYDCCVANKTVGGKQMTIVWHVDDLKVSHFDPRVVTRMADWLKKKYERLFDDGSGAMKICRGNIHEYLGMTLDLSALGEVKVTMIPYIKEIVDLFRKHDDTDRIAATPASDHLFKVNDDTESLGTKKANVFHHFTAKCLFATKRGRPDIATAIAYLSTRVKGPDRDD